MYFLYPPTNKEQTVQIEIGKTYVTCDDELVSIDFADVKYAVGHFYRGERLFVSTWTLDGKHVGILNSCLNLVKERSEPITVDRYVNLFADMGVSVTTFKRPEGVIGRKLVRITEGVFE